MSILFPEKMVLPGKSCHWAKMVRKEEPDMIQISHHLNGYTILNSLISIVVVSIFALAGIKNMTDISRQMLRNKIVLDDVMTEKNEE